MFSVNGTTITLTRGDTFKANIDISLGGDAYTPEAGDEIRFAMKQSYSDDEPAILVNIPVDTMKLVINSEDTKNLEYGTYVYDIQLTYANGDVDTFIKGKLKLTEEVD